MNFDRGIYIITSPSGRQYVGSAMSFKARWKLHLIELRAQRHHCAPLQRAFNKYGEANLRFAKVAFCDADALIKREQEQIDERGFDDLYNVNPVAGSVRGRPVKPETRAKMSARFKGRKLSAEHIQKLKAAERPPHTDAQRAKMSKAMRGRKMNAAAVVQRAVARSASKTLFVAFDSSRNQWIARPIVNGTPHNLGRFDTIKQAEAAVRLFLLIGA